MPATTTKLPGSLYFGREPVQVECVRDLGPTFSTMQHHEKTICQTAHCSSAHLVLIREISDGVGLYRETGGCSYYRVRVTENEKGVVANV